MKKIILLLCLSTFQQLTFGQIRNKDTSIKKYFASENNYNSTVGFGKARG
jgi:hypothetical protein